MEIINKYGADALRFALIDSTLVKADDLKFSDEIVKDVLKSLLIPLWNAYSFFVTYANIDGYEPGKTEYKDLNNPLDRWIISATNRLIHDVEHSFDTYDVQGACNAVVSFVDDLNNWYIRRSRRRFWRSENDADKKAAYDTLYKVLLTVMQVACPLIPFITEEVYQNLKTDDMPLSIHLSYWPEYRSDERDEALEREMSLVMQTITMGRALRSSSNLKIRQPLASFFIVDRNADERQILENNIDIIKEELNVKEVHIESDETELVSYSAKANFKALGSRLGKNMKEVAAIIQTFTNDDIASILDGKAKSVTYSAGSIDITSDDLAVNRSEKENVKVLNEGSITVGYDTNVTEELLLEGIARDIVRFIQSERKESGFEVSDHIKVAIKGEGRIDDAVKAYSSYIANETLADSLEVEDNDGKSGEIADSPVKVKIEKV